MNRRVVGFIFIIFLIVGCKQEKPLSVSSATNAYIERVEDGDTVLAEMEKQTVRVRLIGIDSPEIAGRHISKTQPYGPQARDFLKKRIENKWVKIKGSEKDIHKRLLSTLYLEGEDINLKMVAVGLAEVYPGFSNSEYLEAEKKARIQKLNLWLSQNRVSPKEWRKKYKIKTTNSFQYR